MKEKKATRLSVTRRVALSRLFTTSAWHQDSGSPAWCSISTMRKHDSGVSCAGLTITGQPTATAGHTWCTIKFNGWLKALTATTTPMGNLRVPANRPSEAGFRFIGISLPDSVLKTSIQFLTPSMARVTSTRESMSGFPPSRAASTDSSSALSRMIPAVFSRIAIRSAGGSHLSRAAKTRAAFASAVSTAAPSAAVTSPISRPS